jgi:putative membrane protein
VWGTFFDVWLVGPPVAGAALGILAVRFVPALKRALAGEHELAERVHQRAMGAFVEQQVFKTRDRTGILLFLSLFERRVEVLADVGISASVKQEEWDGIVGEIVAGIRAGKPGAALASAIERCGELLASHGVTIRPDDTDELPDQLQVREE